jgi:ABC-type branched-subunit amino acid transport system substrate-binding protein
MRMTIVLWLRGLAATVALVAFAVTGSGAALGAAPTPSAGSVVIPRGQPLQIAFTASESELGDISTSVQNAVQMAIEAHPTVHGFPVQLNVVQTPCTGDATAAATAIVANPQNTAVIGHLCSDGFLSALPIYEAAGIVTISGSATADALPGTLGPTVFNRTVVRDGDPGSAAWFAQVAALPSVRMWAQAYEARFGEAPFELAPFYYDAASIVLRQLARSSSSSHGDLVINRHALAEAVRHTTKFNGVTCRVTLDPATGNRINDPRSLARCAADSEEPDED